MEKCKFESHLVELLSSCELLLYRPVKPYDSGRRSGARSSAELCYGCRVHSPENEHMVN